ncbi:wax ester/triacylglycerol synthase domain-containing protein [Amycolatopsis sp. PS_44_ISF1]|uniref:wax ester/triacylglycerol synthase domain-containing protein n=1 Tax=Amycolatopsis sp. PS_44_ISF1 TaxID=2974917 RepID=UPI0028DD79D6|nr:wax ester/triacylglycerol synthase domain-containing protein [Amycolatopsis sp. PS_44_ISF1]MDT8914967.1 WS/DGAT domain-containing protein [Amycolatopsis sp. PS_44_ISF1]
MDPATFDRVRFRREWPRNPELNPVESLAWRADSLRGLRFNLVGVVLLETVPPWGRLVARHEWLVRYVPRLRQCVVESPVPWGRPLLEADPRFDLGRHLHRVRLPWPGTRRQLLDHAQALGNGPFDPFRPPWESVLIEGLEGGGAAYVCKMHHTLADGIGAGQLLALLHDGTPGEPELPAPPETRDTRENGLTRSVRASSALVSSLWDGRGGSSRRPDPGVRDLARTLLSMARMTVWPEVPSLPLFRSRSHTSRFELLDLPRARLRAAGAEAGGTANDALLAALAGGVERYHRRCHSPVRRIPGMFPLSLRRPQDPPGGNLVGAAHVMLPGWGHSPSERIRIVHRQVATILRGATFDALDLLLHPVSALPAAAVRAVAAMLFTGVDVLASSFPGASLPLYLAGAPVTAIHPFPPQVRTAVCTAMLSYRDRAQLGLTLDTGAITDPGLFMTCLGESIAELLDLAPPGGSASARTT